MGNLQLSETLRALRKAKRYTQQYISDYLSISRQAYSNYENNKRTPDVNALKKLAELYHVSLDYLLDNQTPIGVFESPGVYYPGIDIDSGETFYLAKDEKELLELYRVLPDDEKKMVKDFFLFRQPRK